MSDRVRTALADLDDPTRYVRVPAVAVFDEHADTVWTKDGRQVPEGTKGARKAVHRFDKKRLERIAANCNERTRTGDWCPITIGHTNPDEPDEQKQPEIVGYAKNFRVGYDRTRRKWMLYGDYHFHRHKYAKAQEYPRSSVELWPGTRDEGDILDPIAILKRTSARDIGQWRYGRPDRLVLRYSMESPMTTPTHPEHDDISPDEVEQFERHCASHPLYAKYHAHKAKMYAMDAAPEGPPADPTDFPDADEPAQFAADGGPGAPAFGGDTNAGLPKPPGEKAAQYKRDSAAIRFARMERELTELRQYAKKAADAAAEAEARRIVGQLEAEGFDLDVIEEVTAFQALDEAGRARRADHVRRFYKQAPVTPVGRVPLARDAAPAGDGEPQNPAHHARALHYVRTHGGTYEAAVEKTKQA